LVAPHLTNEADALVIELPQQPSRTAIEGIKHHMTETHAVALGLDDQISCDRHLALRLTHRFRNTGAFQARRITHPALGQE
jgi:hypothetical protein